MEVVQANDSQSDAMAQVAPLILDWWLSLKVASTLAAGTTSEVVQAAEEISPTKHDWTERVCAPR